MAGIARALRGGAMLVLALAACSSDQDGGPRDGSGRQRPNSASGSAGTPGGAAIPGGGAVPGAGAAQAGAGSSMVPVGDGCAAISQTADNRLQPADIIFAVDNSGSMDEEIVFVREQLNAFSQQIVDSGVDVRIILISAPIAPAMDAGAPSLADLFDDDDDQDNGICIAAPLGSGNCPGDSNPPRYLHVPTEVKSHDALNLFVSTFPEWRDQLRPSSTKTFVAVTDDNAEDAPNNSAAAFSAAVGALDPVLFTDWSLSGIYCFSECPEAAEIGTVYSDLVMQTQGVGGDLCLQDFALVFDALAQSVIDASGIDCRWDIPAPPQGQTFEIGRVNVQYTASGAPTPQTIFHVPSMNDCATSGGWFYDDNASPTKVIVCPSTCDLFADDANAKLDVLFGCETKDGPD